MVMKSELEIGRVPDVEPEVAVVSAHEHDFVARRDRACLWARRGDRRLSGDGGLIVRGACQKRVRVTRLSLN